jgi:hypothetical protein
MANYPTVLTKERNLFILHIETFLTLTINVQRNYPLQRAIQFKQDPNSDIIAFIEKLWRHLYLSGFPHSARQIIHNLWLPIELRDAMDLCPNVQATELKLRWIFLTIIILDQDSLPSERPRALVYNLFPIS